MFLKEICMNDTWFLISWVSTLLPYCLLINFVQQLSYNHDFMLNFIIGPYSISNIFLRLFSLGMLLLERHLSSTGNYENWSSFLSKARALAPSTRFSNSGFCHLGVNFFVFLSKFKNKNRFEILVQFPDWMWYLKRPDD